jgi:hypothetical protein
MSGPAYENVVGENLVPFEVQHRVYRDPRSQARLQSIQLRPEVELILKP